MRFVSNFFTVGFATLLSRLLGFVRDLLMAAFEEGVKLTRECQQALRSAEQKVRILLAADGQPEAFGESPDEQ